MTERREDLIARLTFPKPYTASDLESMGSVSLRNRDGRLSKDTQFVLVGIKLRDEIIAALRIDGVSATEEQKR